MVLALMTYRNTPIAVTGYSPAELMIGRQMRTTLPVMPQHLQPHWPDRNEICMNDKHAKNKYEYYYNKHHSVRQREDLKPGEYYYNKHHSVRQREDLKPGDSVRIKLDHQPDWNRNGTILNSAEAPRSYLVQTSDGGIYRRTKRHLLKVPNSPPVENTSDLADEIEVSKDPEVRNEPDGNINQDLPVEDTDLSKKVCKISAAFE